MEPAGWATVAASLVAMFGAIAVAVIQRQRAKPGNWNGTERRIMEHVASDAVNRHVMTCPNMAAVKDELVKLRQLIEQHIQFHMERLP